MFFGKLKLILSKDAETHALEQLAEIQKHPFIAEINPVPTDWRTAWADMAFTIDGLQYMVMADALNPDTTPQDVDALESSLRQLAEQNAEITVTCGRFDQDVCASQGTFPGGGLTIQEFYPGRLQLIDDHWCKPDGTRFESFAVVD